MRRFADGIPGARMAEPELIAPKRRGNHLPNRDATRRCRLAITNS